MHADSRPAISPKGYAGAIVTKPPPWHNLIAFDMLGNALSMGLFLTAAVGELAAPERLAPLAWVAYSLALFWLGLDMVCLVLDLGDPLRFHHMLRVFKPSSPMSFGTWSLVLYSVPLVLIVALQWWTSSVFHIVLIALALLPSLAAVGYKGVLFSTTAQPAWRDARWLGGFHTTTAIVMGAAQLLAIGILVGAEPATALLRPALAILLLLSVIPLDMLWLNLVPSLDQLSNTHALKRAFLLYLIIGIVLPFGLVWFDAVAVLAGVLCILAMNLLLRREIVMLPHRCAEHH